METSAIRYRVADFLKQHPPFNAMEDADLIALAENGRVRFYEANEFILWQGEPHKAHVFVIQQGTVSLWDERSGEAELRDVRGAGDLLGVEQFNGAPSVLFSARSTSDVVVYGLSADDFGELLTKYPYARQFVSALGSVVTDFKRTDERADPRRMFLQYVAGPLQTCGVEQSVADAARMLTRTGCGGRGCRQWQVANPGTRHPQNVARLDCRWRRQHEPLTVRDAARDAADAWSRRISRGWRDGDGQQRGRRRGDDGRRYSVRPAAGGAHDSRSRPRVRRSAGVDPPRDSTGL